LQRKWLREYIENKEFGDLKHDKLKIFSNLLKNETFTNFVKNKWNTSKRFGLEGCDSLIAGLAFFVDKSAADKVDDIVLAMPHRG
jgi:2-oxoglutarate dehydrogenase E1 component